MSTGLNLFEIIRQFTGWSPVPIVTMPRLVVPTVGPRVRVIDRRSVVRPIELSPVYRVVNGKRIRTSQRETPRIVMLHQMDCELGVSKKQLAEAGGDVLEARVRRAMGQPYHDVVLRGDILVRNHPYTIRTAHGGLGNAAIGIGIEGKFPLLARDRTVKHTDLALVLHAARHAVELAVAELRGTGSRAIELQAHRQWSKGRAPDPGEEIWREVGLHAAEALGLTIDYELGAVGLPIPLEWDPSAHYGIKDRIGG